jgi:hypothetical protein
MTARNPNAVIRNAKLGCAKLGCVQGTVEGNVGGDFLRLSYLSLLPTPAPTLRPRTLPVGITRTLTLTGSTLAMAKRSERRAERRESSWRHDGLAMVARYRDINDVQVADAMPNQESPKSKAFASA